MPANVERSPRLQRLVDSLRIDDVVADLLEGLASDTRLNMFDLLCLNPWDHEIHYSDAQAALRKILLILHPDKSAGDGRASRKFVLRYLGWAWANVHEIKQWFDRSCRSNEEREYLFECLREYWRTVHVATWNLSVMKEVDSVPHDAPWADVFTVAKRIRAPIHGWDTGRENDVATHKYVYSPVWRRPLGLETYDGTYLKGDLSGDDEMFPQVSRYTIAPDAATSTQDLRILPSTGGNPTHEMWRYLAGQGNLSGLKAGRQRPDIKRYRDELGDLYMEVVHKAMTTRQRTLSATPRPQGAVNVPLPAASVARGHDLTASQAQSPHTPQRPAPPPMQTPPTTNPRASQLPTRSQPATSTPSIPVSQYTSFVGPPPTAQRTYVPGPTKVAYKVNPNMPVDFTNDPDNNEMKSTATTGRILKESGVHTTSSASRIHLNERPSTHSTHGVSIDDDDDNDSVASMDDTGAGLRHSLGTAFNNPRQTQNKRKRDPLSTDSADVSSRLPNIPNRSTANAAHYASAVRYAWKPEQPPPARPSNWSGIDGLARQLVLRVSEVRRDPTSPWNGVRFPIRPVDGNDFEHVNVFMGTMQYDGSVWMVYGGFDVKGRFTLRRHATNRNGVRFSDEVEQQVQFVNVNFEGFFAGLDAYNSRHIGYARWLIWNVQPEQCRAAILQKRNQVRNMV